MFWGVFCISLVNLFAMVVFCRLFFRFSMDV